MTIIPNQPFGIGDCIFTQTLVRRIANGNPIVWPVFPQFVDQLNRAYPDIRFVDQKSVRIDYERKEQHEVFLPLYGKSTVLPLRHAAEIMGVGYEGWMSSKYELYGMDCQDWRENAMWVRDEEKAKSLLGSFDNGHNTHTPYALKNVIFGSDSKLNIRIPTLEYREIWLRYIDEYSLFDWQDVIMNASAIHTVNTSIIYLLEMLDLKAPEVHLYQRSIPGQTFSGIDYLLKRHKYVFHG